MFQTCLYIIVFSEFNTRATWQTGFAFLSGMLSNSSLNMARVPASRLKAWQRGHARPQSAARLKAQQIKCLPAPKANDEKNWIPRCGQDCSSPCQGLA